jgi:hypothetical protein
LNKDIEVVRDSVVEQAANAPKSTPRMNNRFMGQFKYHGRLAFGQPGRQDSSTGISSKDHVLPPGNDAHRIL